MQHNKLCSSKYSRIENQVEEEGTISLELNKQTIWLEKKHL